MSGRLINRPVFDQRLAEFADALFLERRIGERIMAGQQFNAYQHGDPDDDEDDEDAEFLICLGPVTDALSLGDVSGRDRARLIETALKVATEAFLASCAKGETA